MMKTEEIRDAAVGALVALGYDRLQSQEAIRRALKAFPDVSSVEELIKKSLNHV